MTLRQIEYALGTLAAALLLGITAWVALTVGTSGALVELRTTPDRASAYVDGHFIGTTPVPDRQLPAGKHVLHVTKFGYVPLLCEIDLHTGKNVLQFDLAERPGGTLDIKSTPPGADIFVDGEPCGQTPKTLRKLTTGGHRLRLSLVNYIDWMETVEIEEDKTVPLDVTLNTRTETVYLEAIKADPKNAVLQVDLAHYYITRSEWQKAEDAFTSSLVLTATVSESAGYSGRLQQELEKVFRGMFNYEDLKRGQQVVVNALIRSVKAAPKYLRNYTYAVNYSIELGQFDKAQEILEMGILTFPYDQNWPLTALQNEFRKQGSREKLLEALEKRIKESPDDFVSHFQRMTLLRQKGDTDEVIAEYDHLIRLAKSTEVKGKLLGEQGRLWERKHDWEKAVEAYRGAVKAETSNREAAPVQYNLVRALAQLKNDDETSAAWEKAVQLQENDEVACRWRIEWAEFCIRAAKLDKARAVLADVLKLSKDDKTRSRAEELTRSIDKK